MLSHDEINSKLNEVETTYGIRILYAVESGSRAWGFASADSDFDIRFIYVEPVREYLRLTPKRDVIEYQLDDIWDVNGWDMLKTCRLLRKTNPPLLEWLGSPIIYREAGLFAQQLRELNETYFNARAAAEHYASMLKNQWRSYIEGRNEVVRKKYLYALRPAACIEWLIQYHTFPPTAFTDTINGIKLDQPVYNEIEQLIREKQNGKELAAGPAIQVLNEYLDELALRFNMQRESIPASRFPESALNQLIADIVMENKR